MVKLKGISKLLFCCRPSTDELPTDELPTDKPPADEPPIDMSKSFTVSYISKL
jgi:hypothetical protein